MSTSDINIHALLENSPVCSKIIDLESRLQYMSAAGIKRLKITDADSYYGTPYPPLFFSESARTPLTKHLQIALGGEVSSVEALANDMEGGEVWYDTTFLPFRNEKKQIEYIIAISVDITDRKCAEITLEKSHERFVAIMNSLDALVYVSDFDTHELLFVNRFGHNAWGDIIGKKCWQSLQTGQIGPCEFCTNDRLLDKNGEPTGIYAWEFQNTINRHWYECRDQAITWTDGRLVRMEIATDVTLRKHTEQEKQSLMDSLAEKMKEMGNLFRIVSHDLKSPLVNIQGFSNILVTDCQELSKIISKAEVDKRTQNSVSDFTNSIIPESCDYINKSAKKMLNLLHGLSKISRLGRVELEIEPLDMNEMITTIIKSECFLAQQLNAFVEYQQMPNCLGDKTQINQVFSNLLNNALKYLDPNRKGNIHLSGRVENNRSIYCVKDNGIGIAENQTARVFDMFHRIEPEAKVSGEGLGLATVKQILQRQDGKVWLESEPGKGSRFFVSLPTTKT